MKQIILKVNINLKFSRIDKKASGAFLKRGQALFWLNPKKGSGAFLAKLQKGAWRFFG
jgi:hypothetical protein